MRFLANENYPLARIRLLRAAGHVVESIAENSSGIKDRQVLELARNIF